MVLRQSDFFKIRIAVPVDYADKIRQVLGEAGAGKQGNYVHCTGSWKQIGRFSPQQGSNPAIGTIGELEEVEEEMIEALCHKDLVEKVIKEVARVHPYEEPAIDIIPRYDLE
ncbi:MAG: hypothetical protein Q8N81_05695 [bacterium]|nr:hypothetical protein [bacterium]